MPRWYEGLHASSEDELTVSSHASPNMTAYSVGSHDSVLVIDYSLIQVSDSFSSITAPIFKLMSMFKSRRDDSPLIDTTK